MDKANIPYSLTDDGTKIYAPNNILVRARIVAASTNSVAGSLRIHRNRCFSLYGKDNEESSNRRRVVKNDKCFGNDWLSRVHIVEPEDSPFLSRQSEGSAASVVLWLAENGNNGQGFTRPNSDQLKGIASLVAAAVRGLTPNKVVIVDQEGNLLRGYLQDEDPNIASSTSLLELKRLEEKNTHSPLRDLLSGIVKGNNVKVAVSVDLVRETKESSVQSYDPTQQVTISEKINESASSERDSAEIHGSENNYLSKHRQQTKVQ